MSEIIPVNVGTDNKISVNDDRDNKINANSNPKPSKSKSRKKKAKADHSAVAFPNVGAVILTWDCKYVILVSTVAKPNRWMFPRATVDAKELTSMTRDRCVFSQTGLRRSEHLQLVQADKVETSVIDEYAASKSPSTRYYCYIWKSMVYRDTLLQPDDRKRFQATQLVLVQDALVLLRLDTQRKVLQSALDFAAKHFVPPNVIRTSVTDAENKQTATTNTISNISIVCSETKQLGWQVVSQSTLTRGTVAFVDRPLVMITGDELTTLNRDWHNDAALFLVAKLVRKAYTYTMLVNDFKLTLRSPISVALLKQYSLVWNLLASQSKLTKADLVHMYEIVTTYMRPIDGFLTRQQTGHALFPIVAHMNHECKLYNTILFTTTVPPQCTAVLIRDVAVDEPLTITYCPGSAHLPLPVRQMTLSSLFFHSRSDKVGKQPCLCLSCLEERQLAKTNMSFKKQMALETVELDQFTGANSGQHKAMDELVTSFATTNLPVHLRYFLLFQNLIPHYCALGLGSLAKRLGLSRFIPEDEPKPVANQTDPPKIVAHQTDPPKTVAHQIDSTNTVEHQIDQTKTDQPTTAINDKDLAHASTDNKQQSQANADDKNHPRQQFEKNKETDEDKTTRRAKERDDTDKAHKADKEKEKEEAIEKWRRTPEGRDLQLLTDFFCKGLKLAKQAFYHLLSLDQQLLFHFTWNFCCWEAKHHHVKNTYLKEEMLQHPLPEHDPLASLWTRLAKQTEPSGSFCLSYCTHMSKEMHRLETGQKRHQGTASSRPDSKHQSTRPVSGATHTSNSKTESKRSTTRSNANKMPPTHDDKHAQVALARSAEFSTLFRSTLIAGKSAAPSGGRLVVTRESVAPVVGGLAVANESRAPVVGGLAVTSGIGATPTGPLAPIGPVGNSVPVVIDTLTLVDTTETQLSTVTDLRALKQPNVLVPRTAVVAPVGQSCGEPVAVGIPKPGTPVATPNIIDTNQYMTELTRWYDYVESCERLAKGLEAEKWHQTVSPTVPVPVKDLTGKDLTSVAPLLPATQLAQWQTKMDNQRRERCDFYETLLPSPPKPRWWKSNLVDRDAKCSYVAPTHLTIAECSPQCNYCQYRVPESAPQSITVSPTTLTNSDWNDEHVLQVMKELANDAPADLGAKRLIKKLSRAIARDQAVNYVKDTFTQINSMTNQD